MVLRRISAVCRDSAWFDSNSLESDHSWPWYDDRYRTWIMHIFLAPYLKRVNGEVTIQSGLAPLTPQLRTCSCCNARVLWLFQHTKLGLFFCRCSDFRIMWLIQSGAAGCEKGVVKCFLRVPQVVGLYCPSKEGELSENILQNLFHNLPPQTVLRDTVGKTMIPWSMEEQPNHQNPAGRGKSGSALSTCKLTRSMIRSVDHSHLYFCTGCPMSS